VSTSGRPRSRTGIGEGVDGLDDPAVGSRVEGVEPVADLVHDVDVLLAVDHGGGYSDRYTWTLSGLGVDVLSRVAWWVRLGRSGEVEWCLRCRCRPPPRMRRRGAGRISTLVDSLAGLPGVLDSADADRTRELYCGGREHAASVRRGPRAATRRPRNGQPGRGVAGTAVGALDLAAAKLPFQVALAAPRRC